MELITPTIYGWALQASGGDPPKLKLRPQGRREEVRSTKDGGKTTTTTKGNSQDKGAQIERIRGAGSCADLGHPGPRVRGVMSSREAVRKVGLVLKRLLKGPTNSSQLWGKCEIKPIPKRISKLMTTKREASTEARALRARVKVRASTEARLTFLKISSRQPLSLRPTKAVKAARARAKAKTTTAVGPAAARSISLGIAL